jgi:excisionase family DNA binding protein
MIDLHCDVLLGPEMESTGERMGIGSHFAIAFATSQLAAGVRLPRASGVLISVQDDHRHRAIEFARHLDELGFTLCAAAGTGRYLCSAGLKVERVNKETMALPIRWSCCAQARRDYHQHRAQPPVAADSFAIRGEALMLSVPYFTTIQAAPLTPVAAPSDQQAQIVALSRAMESMSHLPKRRSPKCQLVGSKGEAIALPEAVFYVLERVAEVMARGDSITVVPVGKEVTTQQAADLLNVSRQYLFRLLDGGRIPFRRTGKHRRLRIEDGLAFKENRDKDRRAGLRELSQLTQEFGGYEAEPK